MELGQHRGTAGTPGTAATAGARSWPRTGRLALLLSAALGMQAIYAAFFVARYPLRQHVDTPLLDLGKLGGYEPATGAAVAAAFGLLFVLHALAWWAAIGLSRRLMPLVLVVSLVFQVTLLAVYPIVAADVFNYVLQGRLAAVHGLNPLTAMPRDAVADPWLAYSAYPHIQLAYGPVWVALATLVAQASRESVLTGVLSVKVLALLANVANTGLIVAIAQRVLPGATLAAAVTYAWSPLVLFETVANAHNDGLLATPILLALWLIVRGGRGVILAPAALMLAILIKYTPLALLPVVLIGAWRALRPTSTRQATVLALAGGLALAGTLAVAAYAPYWAGLDTLAGVRRQATETTTSLAAVLAKGGWMPSDPDAWLGQARLVAGALLAIVIVVRRPRAAASTPAAVFDVLLVQLLMATFWFQPWYVVPLVAVAAASASAWRGRVAMAFAISATATYIVYFYLWTTPWWGTLSDLQVQVLAVVVAFGPPLAVLIGERWRRRQQRVSMAAPSPP